MTTRRLEIPLELAPGDPRPVHGEQLASGSLMPEMLQEGRRLLRPEGGELVIRARKPGRSASGDGAL